jgi:hypothetical protein
MTDPSVRTIERALNPPLFELAPPDYHDPVVEVYKRDIDRTLLRESLKLTVQQRLEKFERFMETIEELRRAGERSRASKVSRGE